MNKKIIIKVLVWALAYLSITNSFAASDIATQTIGFSIQEVALISVGTDVTITLDPITNAGDNFSQKTEQSEFAITSNVVPGNTRHVSVRISEELTDLDLRVQMSESSKNIVGQATLTTTNQTVISGIENIASSNNQILYTLIPTTISVVSYGSKTITVTYTLSDDS